ncbi:MAG: GSU2403 family nucleotidyltransferase fold protein [Candidatus Aureabacteria bacterium]|nr:GSU2403 family nucleotidyltransferase fold protein [Candidatus Auribacterota bacterium]
MEKKQYDLCFEILRRFSRTHLLDDFILIGSWCVVFYKDYFASHPFIDHAVLRTRDMDFLIATPHKMLAEVDIPLLLKDLGYVKVFKTEKGYMKLAHPDLMLEFLVPEKGRGMDKSYNLPGLGIKATALRFLNFLTDNTIRVKIENFYLTVPHPANFALHKLIIFQRRVKEDKALKDRNAAIEILRALIGKGESDILHQVFKSIPDKWQIKIRRGLDEIMEQDIVAVL